VYHVYRDLVRRRAVKIEEVEARLSLRHDPVT
ncbi:MAG: hypothetical protein QOD64_1227, partial [Verrucomicrobiota bacterium]